MYPLYVPPNTISLFFGSGAKWALSPPALGSQSLSVIEEPEDLCFILTVLLSC